MPRSRALPLSMHRGGPPGKSATKAIQTMAELTPINTELDESKFVTFPDSPFKL